MNIKQLVHNWEEHAHASLKDETHKVHLSLEDAAKIDALCELYPRRNREQIVSELVAAALAELEESFPYIAGNEIAAMDEFGDPTYKDAGRTPEFQSLTRKYLARYKAANG